MKKFKSPELQFENTSVRIWKTHLEPGESLELDRPEISHIVVDLNSQKVYWNPRAVQLGDVMVIEMKTLIDSPLPSIPLE